MPRFDTKPIDRSGVLLGAAVGLLGACTTAPPAPPPPAIEEVPAEALNADVTQATIDKTVCVSGYAASLRPSSTFTKGIKARLVAAQGIPVGDAGSKCRSSWEGMPATRETSCSSPWRARKGPRRRTGSSAGFETWCAAGALRCCARLSAPRDLLRLAGSVSTPHAGAVRLAGRPLAGAPAMGREPKCSSSDLARHWPPAEAMHGGLHRCPAGSRRPRCGPGGYAEGQGLAGAITAAARTGLFIVCRPVEAAGQHVQKEAAHELVR
jgi:hypothetical protein